MAPIHLRLLAWLCFESPDHDRQCFFPLRTQPVCQNRVTAGVTAFPQFAQQHPRVQTSVCSRSFRSGLNGSSLLAGAGLGPSTGLPAGRNNYLAIVLRL